MEQQVSSNSVNQPGQSTEQIKYSNVLSSLLEQIKPIDFRELVTFKDEKGELKKKHYLVCSIEQVLAIAKQNKWGLCRHNDFIYVYNGAYWESVDLPQLQAFLAHAVEKMGVGKYEARIYTYQENLLKQFFVAAYLPKPENKNSEVYINLQNGTFVISPEKQDIKPHDSNDFLTYRLPFNYNPNATAPLFNEYLNKALPDKDRQKILAEYLGYIFIPTSFLKMEKALLLHGGGANGKSVFFEIVLALLGSQNVSSYSLQSLTGENTYFRAMIANKLLNYASEINGKLESSFFKLLVSGEPIEARLPYGEPFTLTNYAKLMFNCNELPRDVEQTSAFFRRFLIVPFDVTIPEHEQDKELAAKIIKMELSGIFNWVLDGLKRLLAKKKFTDCKAVSEALESYKINSNTVSLFLQENNYIKSKSEYVQLKLLYIEYRGFCYEGGYTPVNKGNFITRLKGDGILIGHKNIGNVVYIETALI